MIDRYQIIRLIIKDKLGGIYLAKDTETNREVCFRNFDTGSTEIPISEWEESYTLFATKLKDLQHPNLIPIHDTLIDDEHPVLISEFIEAETIAEQLQEKAFSAEQTVVLATHLLTALQAAHHAGIFHGALHPGSVKSLPNKQGGCDYLITDLGIKQLSSIVTGEETHPEDPIMVAPELHDQTAPATAQSDIFTIGQLCYTALAGGHPFPEHSAEKCARLYKANKLPPLSQFAPNIPPALSNWIRTLTDGSPTQRPASAAEALKSLQAIQLSSPDKKPQATPAKKSKRGYLIGAVALLAISAGLFFTLNPKKPKKDSGSQAAHTLAPPKDQEKKTSVHSNSTQKSSDEVLKKDDILEPGPYNPYKILTARKINKRSEDFKPKDYYDWSIPQKIKNLKFECESSLNSSYQLELLKGQLKLGIEENAGFVFMKGSSDKILPIAARKRKGTDHSSVVFAEATFTTPPSYQGALEVVFYVTQKNYTLSLLITDSEKKRYRVKSRSKGPGIVKAQLPLPNVSGNQNYRIQFEATPNPEKKSYISGLHGVFIRKYIDPDQPKKDQQLAKKKSTKTKPSSKKPIQKKPSIPRFNPDLMAQVTQASLFTDEKWHHGEGSILKIKEGQYALFYTRWKKDSGSKIESAEIAIAVSNYPYGPWKHWKTALKKGRFQNKWENGGFCCPVIKKFNKGYYLYYVSSIKKKLESNKTDLRRIGFVHAKKTNLKWITFSKPLISPEKVNKDAVFTAEPSIIKSPAGDYLMILQCAKTPSVQSKPITYFASSPKPYGTFIPLPSAPKDAGYNRKLIGVSASPTVLYKGNVKTTLNDAFAYNPLDPTSPGPVQKWDGGKSFYHADLPKSKDAELVYDLETPYTAEAGKSLVVDLYGRIETPTRDDNIDVILYHGDDEVARYDDLKIDGSQCHARANFSFLDEGTSVNKIKIIGHNTTKEKKNYFTLAEVRMAIIPSIKPFPPSRKPFPFSVSDYWYDQKYKQCYYLQSTGSQLNFYIHSDPRSSKGELISELPLSFENMAFKNMDHPRVFLGDDGSPEVLVSDYTSADGKKRGIFTIPFKK